MQFITHSDENSSTKTVPGLNCTFYTLAQLYVLPSLKQLRNYPSPSWEIKWSYSDGNQKSIYSFTIYPPSKAYNTQGMENQFHTTATCTQAINAGCQQRQFSKIPDTS